MPLDIEDISNYGQVDTALGLSTLQNLIEQNGFAVTERDFGLTDPNRESMTAPYKYLKDRGIPLFVTTDTVLHLYHVQFDETLKDIEEREFVADIANLTDALLMAMSWRYEELEGDLKEAARRNVAYLAVARRLINPDGATAEGLPPRAYAAAFQAVAETVDAEIALIEAHGGFWPSPLFIYAEDYSQYVPRGHYTRSEALSRYFKTMMWYGRMAFLLKGWVPEEPNGEALISMHDADIQILQVLSVPAVQRLNSFETMLARMLDIANKELLNQPLTREDEISLDNLPASLESLVAGVTSTGLKTTLVADVHTNIVEETVVEEAVGKVDLMVVACPGAAGSVFLAAGPVLSYYEFKHPMADRLTDEAWRRMLDTPQEPTRPAWYQPLRNPQIPVVE